MGADYSPQPPEVWPHGDGTCIRSAYAAFLVEVTNLPSDPEIESLRGLLESDGRFTDLAYEPAQSSKSVWAYHDHGEWLAIMARAWAAPGHARQGDRRLLAGILTSLDWLWSNHVPANNWWHNEIGIPTSFATLISLLYEQMTPTQRSNAITILQRARLHSWSSSSLPMVGANRLWRAQVSLIEAAFTGNAALAQTEATACSNTLTRTTGEGIKDDNSFHQHSLQLYNGGYGQVLALTGAALLRQLRDTAWALPDPTRDLLIDYLLDGTRWMIHGRWFNYSAVGREITREDTGADPVRTRYALHLLREPGHPRLAAVEDFLAHLEGQAGTTPGLVTGARHFPQSDFTVFRRADHALSVKALSNRTHCQEAGNSENVRGVHLSHGAAFYLTDGLDYRGIIPVWDWKKIPGTTVANNALFADIDPPVKGTTAFVGAVTDGERAVTTYHLDHNHSGRVQGRKSWFLFDGALVALGEGITYSSTSHEIITTLDQTLLRGSVRVADAAGERDLPDGNTTLSGARWVLHGTTGYFLPAPTTIQIQKGSRPGRWSDTSARERDDRITLDTLGLWQSHGMGAALANSYAYAILPQSTPASLQSAALAAPFAIVSNDPTLQAVHHPASATTGFVFHTAGSAAIPGGPVVTVDRPCALLVRREGDDWHVTGSDPGAGTGTLTVSLTGVGTLALTLPTGTQAGGSVGATAVRS
jgi:chondroitin AC lyase